MPGRVPAGGGARVIRILGISGYGAGRAACLLADGEIVAAAEHPNAVELCLERAGIAARQLDHVVFHEKPRRKWRRRIETFADAAPRGFASFLRNAPRWWKARDIGFSRPVLYTEHHEAHAASAYFPSPLERAAVLTVDGAGEWATASYGYGRGNQLYLLAEMHYPHSLGLLYAALARYIGADAADLAHWAPAGEPRYVSAILDRLVDLREDGSLRLNLEFFDLCRDHRLRRRCASLLGGPPRAADTPSTQREMDLARSAQEVAETALVRMARHVRRETGDTNLCLAGGVALNAAANRKILRQSGFERVWIQPAPGNAGGAVGAAYSVWHQYLDQPRPANAGGRDWMQAALLGPEYTDREMAEALEGTGDRVSVRRPGRAELVRETARLLAAGKSVGWFQGRMEFAAHALGARSILRDPRPLEKPRGPACAVLAEEAGRWFGLEAESPYMLVAAPVAGATRIPVAIQTVRREDHPLFYELIAEFGRLTGCPVLANARLGAQGGPPVCTPQDAVRFFLNTGLDALALGGFLAEKYSASKTPEGAWQAEYQVH